MPAKVKLLSPSPEEVEVQALGVLVDADGNLKQPIFIRRQLSKHDPARTYLFRTVIHPSTRTDIHAYAIRLLPKHADSVSVFLPGLMKWAQASSPVAELQVR